MAILAANVGNPSSIMIGILYMYQGAGEAKA
jgi:hypothetical protein